MTTMPARIPLPALSRRTATRVLAGSVLAALVLVVVAHGPAERTGPLGWSGDAKAFAHPTLPGDRLVTGTLRNDGAAPLRLDLADVQLVDGDGSPVPGTPVFLRASGKSLWGPALGATPADPELLRTGRITLLAPGEEVPLTVAWHTKDGDPERVDYGRGSVRLPQ
ncbi:MAG TPA: hypothetical protein VHJ39_10145 [Solirubrobacteraceae bacterium]|jgi:hypothetical protein|nr:hypothetical protein [Solirubrobacteraceae bacterium]